MRTSSASTDAVDLPDLSSITVTTVLQALADPVRLEVVRQLAACDDAGELACKDICVPVTKSTASHHLKVLSHAGITAEREQGTYKYVKLRRPELDERFPGLLDSVLRANGPA